MQAEISLEAGLPAAPSAWFAEWVAAERGRFGLWFSPGMAAGVVGYFSLTVEPPWWVGAVFAAALFVLVWLVRPWAVARGVCLGLAAAALGFASAQFATARAPDVVEIPTHAVVVTGSVRAVEALPKGLRLTLDRPQFGDDAPLNRAVRIRLRANDAGQPHTGDTVRVRALLMRPAPPAYPGGWDLQRDAYFAGMGAFGYALNPMEVVRQNDAAGFSARLQGLREDIALRIRTVLPGSEGAIAATLLTGATSSIPEVDRAAYRDSGLAHLLAIAGLHIGIVMALVFGATRFSLVLSEYVALHWPVKAIAAVTALAAGGGYMLLTGAHVPIMRSFAMACLVTLGVIAGRRAFSLRGLALAMAAVILLAPQEVMGVSFQMSFSAVLALIVGYAALRPWLTRLYGDGARWRRIAGYIAALALTSALAGTFSAPYGAYHFGHIQIYYVIANMLAVPLTAMWVMPAGLVSLVLMPVRLEALALLPMGWGICAVTWIGATVSSWPASVLAVPHIPAWGLALLSMGLAWVGLWRTRVRYAGVAAVALGLVSPVLTTPPAILVSAEARLIGIRTDDGVFVQKVSGASSFTLDSWLQYWAVHDAHALPAQTDSIGCDDAGCTVREHGRIARILHGSEACDADIVISAEPLTSCPRTVLKIDRFNVWREGAYAVWLGADGVRTVSDAALRGSRPWVLGPPVRNAMPKGPLLPQAQAEELPPE